jgi:hypothetical protein
MDIAATRVDAKSAIYLDNERQSVQRGGEIYFGMVRECYFEPGRIVETMSEDGEDGEATLHQSYTDPQGKFGTKNDFSQGKYKVIVDVTEATATRRDKTIKQMMNIAEISVQAQDMEGAQAAIITATLNMDGEGLTDYQKWQRQRAIKLGLVEPNEEEQAAIDKAKEDTTQQPPDPETILAAAKAQDLDASAKQREADTALKLAQAQAVGGPEAAPVPPDGLEQAHKVVQIRKTAAEADNLETQTQHLPQKLGIGAVNAATNRIKAMRRTIPPQKASGGA